MPENDNIKSQNENQPLIQIYKKQISGQEVNAISARELHEFLKSRQDFSTWINHRLTYGFEQDVDFTIVSLKSTGGRPRQDYWLSLDMGKQLGMLERSLKGSEIRQYFIECEKGLVKRQQYEIPQTFADALLLAGKLEKEKQDALLLIEEQKPKVKFAESIFTSQDCISFRQMANTHFTFGRNKLFRKMRDAKIIDDNNHPYRRYIDSGYFQVTEKPIQRTDGIDIVFVTRITPKGQDWVVKQANKLGWEAK